MSAGSVWWGQIGNSLKLLNRVTEHLRDRRPAVLQVPEKIPWREQFYELLDMRRESFSMDRRMRRIPWREGADPGQFVLDSLCPPKVRFGYWPGVSVAEYLGPKGDLAMCHYYVWVTGIRRQEDLSKWVAFVTGYEAAAAELENRALFILEYEGTPFSLSSLERIDYQVESYDCRVFCLEMASEMTGQSLREYQAELALCIGGNIPELCAALLETGNRLLRDPLSTALEVLRGSTGSDGVPFPERTESEIVSAIWRATVVLLFPILERRRFDFIAKYERELSNYLPINNSNGDRVTEPFDLEIGPLSFIVSNVLYEFPRQEVEEIRLCRKVRNLLAHNKPLSFEDVRAVMTLEYGSAAVPRA